MLRHLVNELAPVANGDSPKYLGEPFWRDAHRRHPLPMRIQTKMDLAALNRTWEQRVKRIAALVETVPGVSTRIQIPQDGNRYPTLTVEWDEAAWKFTVADCDRQLREGEPRIEVLTASNPSLVPAVLDRDPKTPRTNRLHIISMTMQPGEELTVDRRLREILSTARKNARG